MKYRIIEYDECDTLSKIINDYLENGWKLQGGISVTWNRSENCLWYAQAITKGDWD